ncbi:MAG: DUF1273 domain-containing protein [Bacillales bacterium]|nr:DUF1273 domain-containing protein [Bacillales bacterium]
MRKGTDLVLIYIGGIDTKVAAVSGYKPIELGILHHDAKAIDYIKKAIQKEIQVLLEEGLEWVLISGQLGVECWTADVVLDMRIEHPDLKLAVLTPFLNQEKNWNEANQERYYEILNNADFVDSISKQPYTGPWQFQNKNKLFLQKSDCLVLLYDEEKEGSPKYLYHQAKIYQESNPSYAIKQVTFFDLQNVAEEEQWKKHDW